MTNTDDLLEYVLKKKVQYEVEIAGVDITVFPEVFPPVTPFSYDSIPLAEANDTRSGEVVLDIGTGTGIHAIVSALKGARKVVATDISQKAIDNCNYNANKYGVNKIVSVRKGNLFNSVKKDEKFDLIIANIPFVDHPAEEFYEHWVYDPGYRAHRELLGNVKDYLNDKGRLLMAFASLGDIGFIEQQIQKNNLRIKQKVFTEKMDIDWLVYKIVRGLS